MPATLPHTFVDGPGNIASGVQVMNNLAAVNAGVILPTVSSLPGAPVNGQDCFYKADPGATLGGPVVWHLKYDLADNYWYCVGGRPLRVLRTTTGAIVPADGNVTLLTINVPLLGDYDAWADNNATCPTANASNALRIFSAGVDSGEVGYVTSDVSGGGMSGPERVTVAARLTGLLAAGAVTARASTSGTTSSWSRGHLHVMPIRVR